MLNYIFVGISILLVVVFVFSLAIIRLRSLRDNINLRWYNLLDKLQYRQDLVPNLIETVRKFVPSEKLNSHDSLIREAIAHRAHAAKNADPGADKIIQEHDLSDHVNKLFALGEKYSELGQSTNYLELRKEFKGLGAEIERLSKDYNTKVRHHNQLLKKKYNSIPAAILRYRRKQIFDFE